MGSSCGEIGAGVGVVVGGSKGVCEREGGDSGFVLQEEGGYCMRR